jgi:hypothetical protein
MKSMKKAPIKGGQLVTNTTEVKKGGSGMGRGFVSSNPTPITMGVGSKSGHNSTMKTKRKKAY